MVRRKTVKKYAEIPKQKHSKQKHPRVSASVINGQCAYLILKIAYKIRLFFINVAGSGFGPEDDEQSAVPRIRADIWGCASCRVPVDRSAAFIKRLNKSIRTGEKLCRFLDLRFRI